MEEDTSSPMVRVVSAYKSYGQSVVLNGLNMTVPSNRIYALLGPSGCGKTVLLNCMVGLRPLDDGYIKLRINRKKEIGYMPQDIGLPVEFTGNEVFRFYGRMYGLSSSVVRTKMKELVGIFELPDMNQQIRNLSGGEQRRISLVVTLLHEPKLLLLDEPTVGVDPVLSRSIWEFLQRAARNGTTVIITTHYVEEARGAHTVGMMREGQLLVENSPQAVMISLNTDTLESAFLQLSKAQQSNSRDNQKPMEVAKLRTKPKPAEELFKPEGLMNRHRFWAQLTKNCISMRRNCAMVGLLLALPFVLAFLQCESFGYLPKMNIALVTDELDFPGGDQFCTSSRDNYATEDFNCTVSAPLTCVFLQSLQTATTPTIYSSVEEARLAVQENRAWGMLRIPVNFTYAVTGLVLNSAGFQESREVVDDLLNQIEIDAHLDSSNFIMNQLLRKVLSECYYAFLKNLAVSCGFSERLGSSPLQILEPIYGRRDPTLGQSILPAFVSAWCFYFALLFTSGAILSEKSAGLVERNLAAGMSHLELVAAHLVVQIVLITVQKAIMLLIYYVYYDEPLLGSAALLVMLLYTIEAVGVAYGFLITEITSCERNITYNAIVALNITFLVGGILWPVEGAQVAVRHLCRAMPISPAIEAYKSIALKGQGLENLIVVKGFVSCIFWVLVIGGATVLTYRAKNWRKLL